MENEESKQLLSAINQLTLTVELLKQEVAHLREMNEQKESVQAKKISSLEADRDIFKEKIRELEDKIDSKGKFTLMDFVKNIGIAIGAVSAALLFAFNYFQPPTQ